MKKIIFLLLTVFLILFTGSSTMAKTAVCYCDENGVSHYVTDYTEIADSKESFSIGKEGEETWYILNEKTQIEGDVTI